MRYQTAPQPGAADESPAAGGKPTAGGEARPNPTRRGTIAQVGSRPVDEQYLRDLARLPRVRDRIAREYARPLNVESLARDANMSAGHLSR